MSSLGLAAYTGTWTTFGGMGGCSSEETAEAVVALAYDSGINVFDLSEAHSGHRAETQLGRILLRRGWNRSSYVVTTKIYWNTKYALMTLALLLYFKVYFRPAKPI